MSKWSLLLFTAYFCFGHAFDEEVLEAYAQVSDIYHPTFADLRTIQTYFSSYDRPYERMGPKAHIIHDFKLIGESPEELPIVHCIPVNCTDEMRENCIITYASFNQRYPLGVKRLINSICRSDFIGHLRYRIGGWPNVEGGDLVLSHIPFAFKACFFKEVQKMGYKRILWIDSSILPVVSLNQIFEMIAEEGYFILENWHTLGDYMNPYAAEAFGLTVEEVCSIKSCQALLIGIDFSNAKATELIDRWYAAAKHPYAFYSVLSDQNALSILLYQMGMDRLKPLQSLGHIREAHPNMLFAIDRDFVKDDR